MSQSTINRRQRIMAQLLEKQQVTVKQLAESMDVSDATVRRDLRALADEHGLELNHGGASLSSSRDYSYQAKTLRSMESKRVVGRLAAQLIKDGDSIFLDSGTTCSQIVPFLKQRRNLTLVANSTRIAFEMESSATRLFMLGGEYRSDRMDTIGPMAIATLETLRGYTAFIGTDGISMDFGPSASDIESAHLHRQVVHNASSTVLLVDQTKFGSASLFQIVDWSYVKVVVTDAEPNSDWKQFFEENNIEIIYPETKSTDS